MLRLGRALVLIASFGVVPLGGCNAVLGIDEAHTRDGDGASGPLEIPISSCDAPSPPLGCETCIEANCGAFRETCLASHDCREALNDYRACLGASCKDRSCLDALNRGPAADLAACVHTECKAACDEVSPLAEMCDLYCACMEVKLPATAEALPGATCATHNGAELKAWPAGDVATCKTKCRELNDLASVHCRWTHCELPQNGEFAVHCMHAINGSFCPLNAQADGACKDRRIKGWACQKDLQCCGSCNPNTKFCED